MTKRRRKPRNPSRRFQRNRVSLRTMSSHFPAHRKAARAGDGPSTLPCSCQWPLQTQLQSQSWKLSVLSFGRAKEQWRNWKSIKTRWIRSSLREQRRSGTRSSSCPTKIPPFPVLLREMLAWTVTRNMPRIPWNVHKWWKALRTVPVRQGCRSVRNRVLSFTGNARSHGKQGSL